MGAARRWKGRLLRQGLSYYLSSSGTNNELDVLSCMETFEYKTRLSSYDLNIFRHFLGGRLVELSLERPDVRLPPSFELSNNGRAVLAFGTNNGKLEHLEIMSLFREIPPYIDSGGFQFRHFRLPMIKLSDPLIYAKNKQREMLFKNTFSFSYSQDSPIIAFRFYGDHERRYLQETDPDIPLDLKRLKEFGYTEDPKLEVDTVEFFVIVHANGFKTVVNCNSDGLSYIINTKHDLSKNGYQECYTIVNGALKNIVLQHEISLNNR